jgi:hypothetical protein
VQIAPDQGRFSVFLPKLEKDGLLIGNTGLLAK